MLFISIRTDVAWYRLSVPSPKYAPWFNTVLKCARLAVKVRSLGVGMGFRGWGLR